MTTQEEVIRHNKTELSTMKEGDLIQFDRGIYSHWAVYIGEGIVVHVTSSDDSGGSSTSNCCSGRDKAKIVVKMMISGKLQRKLDIEMSPFSRGQIVQNALSNLGKFGYDILFNNCEHFASWCCFRESRSEQADKAKIEITVGGASLVAAALIGASIAVGKSSAPQMKEKALQRSK